MHADRTDSMPHALVVKWRKKPVVIEARRFDGAVVEQAQSCRGTGRTALEQWCGGTLLFGANGVTMRINTLEGAIDASLGDWIIRGVAGEFYPCKPDIFAATYEPADELEATRGRQVESANRRANQLARAFNAAAESRGLDLQLDLLMNLIALVQQELDAGDRSPSAWLPIASAPKDGTAILVHSPSLGPVIVDYDPEATISDGNHTRWRTLWDRTQLAGKPTHWMPLPAAPGGPQP